MTTSNPKTPSQERLDLILNLPVTVSVQLGTTKLSIQQFVKSSPGTVFELNKKSNAPLDVFVNDRLIAKGEPVIVIVNNKVGIRILQILKPEQRLSGLTK